MNDTNWKTWALIFFIGLGLSFELLKSFSSREHSVAELIGLGPTQPYSVNLNGRKARPSPPLAEVTRPTPKKAAGQAKTLDETQQRALLQQFLLANSGSTSFNEEKAKKKEEKCDEKNPKLDPKTGQPIPCKKKKKKDKEEKKDVPPPPPAKEAQTHADIDATMVHALASGELPQPIVNRVSPKNQPNSLEEWIRILLNTPDLDETKRFIDAYQRNLVTADIFYRVTEMMIEDSREDMRKLGVLCAGLGGTSVQSFALLAQLVNAERSGSSARQSAEAYLARYGDINNLTILRRVMSAPPHGYTAVIATLKLDASANRYLNIKDVTASASGPASQAATARIAAARRSATYFQAFVPVLQGLRKSSDGSVKSQATATLSNLQTLLASLTANPSAPTGPTTAAN